MLQISDLRCRYGAINAVDGVSVDIAPASFVGLIGRSGAGKSTLLRSINRLAKPAAGRIVWNGQEVSSFSGRQLRDWRAECAMIFQQFHLVDRMDVLTNVLLGHLNRKSEVAALLRLWTRRERALAMAALDLFGMADLSRQRAGTLSGGQQQRVAIARALVQKPAILLADEPIASLDPHNARAVLECLQRVNRDFGITVICCLHSLELARDYCDRLIGMAKGQIVLDAAAAALTPALAEQLYRPNRDEPAIPDITSSPLPEPAPLAPQG